MSGGKDGYYDYRVLLIVASSVTVAMTCSHTVTFESNLWKELFVVFPQVLSGVVSRLSRLGLLYHSNADRMSKYQILQARDQYRMNPPSTAAGVHVREGKGRGKKGRDREGGREGERERKKGGGREEGRKEGGGREEGSDKGRGRKEEMRARGKEDEERWERK